MNEFSRRKGKADKSACAKTSPSYLPGTFPGTNNPRMIRTLRALLANPLERERLDDVAGCSNGPDLIFELRKMGLAIPCRFKTRHDRDGRICRFGIYHLTDLDRFTVIIWLARRQR